MKKALLNVAIALLFLLVSLTCDRITGVDNEGDGGDLIYSTSFENDTDTTGWQGYGARGFRDEAAPSGGKRSLAISGGCIAPHAFLKLPPVKRDSWLVLRCWGKNLAIGGGVSLGLDASTARSISISVRDSQWISYKSSDTLFCPAGVPLNLCLDAGGIVYSAMLVDLIEVRRVR